MKKLSNPDLHDLPLELRLKVLKEVSKKFKKHFILCPGFDIKTKEQLVKKFNYLKHHLGCLLYTSPSPRDRTRSRMPSSA